MHCVVLANVCRVVSEKGAPFWSETTSISTRPSMRGLSALLELSLGEDAPDPRQTLGVLKQVHDQLLAKSASYRCGRCGFGARSHHWQCPGCKSWPAPSSAA